MFDPINYNSKKFQDIYLQTIKKILNLKQIALHRMKLCELRLPYLTQA
jgi:hypothetical protein